jgi:hypothetical protein
MKEFDFASKLPGTLMRYSASNLQPNVLKFGMEAFLKHSLRKMLHQRDHKNFFPVLKRPLLFAFK